MYKNLMVDKREQRRKRRSNGCFSPNFVWIGLLESNHSFKETKQPASVTTATATHNNALQLQQPPIVIITAHGCLLIPAVFLAWWYWTKRTARRVVRGVLTYTGGGSSTTDDTTTICHSTNDDSNLPQNDIGYKSSSASTVHATNETPSNDKDQYHSLGDGLHENSSSDSSTTSRLIRWMKGTKSSRARLKVRSATLQNLHRKGQIIPMSSSTPKLIEPTDNHDDDGNRSRGDFISFATDSNSRQHLEGITNAKHTAVELCLIRNSSNRQYQTDATSGLMHVSVETFMYGDAETV
jgi:hypothetical protein